MLDRLLGRDYHCRQAHTRSLDSLPLGESTPPQAMRSHLLAEVLRCTRLGCILLSSYSPGDSLNQSPGARYSVARPPPFLEALRLCAHPPHDGVALLAALLRKMRLLILLSASGESHANIISESQCLGAGLPLFTESPRETVWKLLHTG